MDPTANWAALLLHHQNTPRQFNTSTSITCIGSGFRWWFIGKSFFSLNVCLHVFLHVSLASQWEVLRSEEKAQVQLIEFRCTLDVFLLLLVISLFSYHFSFLLSSHPQLLPILDVRGIQGKDVRKWWSNQNVFCEMGLNTSYSIHANLQPVCQRMLKTPLGSFMYWCQNSVLVGLWILFLIPAACSFWRDLLLQFSYCSLDYTTSTLVPHFRFRSTRPWRETHRHIQYKGLALLVDMVSTKASRHSQHKERGRGLAIVRRTIKQESSRESPWAKEQLSGIVLVSGL